MQQVSWEGATTRRLERQGLSGARSKDGPAAVVGAMLAAHAQVLSAAELSIGLRADGLTRTDVRAALAGPERTLVKTYGPRGTVHLLAADELPLWTGALTAVPFSRNTQAEGVRLTGAQTDTVEAAVRDALRGGVELTVDELTDEIVARVGAWAGEKTMEAFQDKWARWRTAVHELAWRGALAFGADRGRKVTLCGPDVEPLPGPAAVAELTCRYLRAYGPATPAHLAKWLSTNVTWARSVFAGLAAEGRIEQVALAGEPGPSWVVAGDTAFPDPDGGGEPADGVRLLPYFDAYGIAAHPRAQVFPGRASERALARGQAGNYPLLLVDGTAAGVWHARRSGKRVVVTVEALDPLSARRWADVEREVERTGQIIEAKPELVRGEVSVGPHA